MLPLHFRDHPLPERKSFGVGIVDSKDLDTLLDPEQEHVSAFAPHRLPIFAFEIERVDVLVFLWRILGILNCAVGPAAKPLPVIVYVRMVRRDLKRDIECNLDLVLLCLAQQFSKLIQCAEVRVNAFMTAFPAAYCPRAADIRRCNDHRIVLAFAKGDSYRMNRGEVDNIETHPCDVREPCLAVLKGPMLSHDG